MPGTGADQCLARGVDGRFGFANCHGLGIKVVHIAPREEILKIEFTLRHSAIPDFFDVNVVWFVRIGEPLVGEDLGCTASGAESLRRFFGQQLVHDVSE